jgi:putative PIN family toxin of toxin-antitoxin system
MRVVFDANVIISGILSLGDAGNKTAHLLDLADQERFSLATSSVIIAEVEHTLEKPYFVSRIEPTKANGVLNFLRKRTIGNRLTFSVSGIATHPADDLILATALSASADFLVTGDKMLLKLGSYSGVTIVNPSGFLAILEGQQ